MALLPFRECVGTHSMKKLCAALILLLLLWPSAAFAQYVGTLTQIQCNKVAIVEAGTSGVQIAIPAVAGQSISICGWNITNSSTNGTMAITFGTQTTIPCDTGIKKLSPAFTVSSNSPNASQTQYATQSSIAGQALCINPSAATFTALVWYAQF